jgi:hypothetical protein
VWETGKVHAGFSWGDFRDKDHLEDLGLNGIITLNRIFIQRRGVEWIDLAQDENWRAVGTMVLHLWVLKYAGNFLNR